MYDLIVFDFDGTVADSLHYGLAQYNALAKQNGFLPVTDVDQARLMRTKAFFKAHKIPLRRLPRLYREFLSLQRAYMPRIGLFDGMKSVLTTLSDRYRIGILSSNSEENIRACLGTNESLDFFEFIVSHKSIFGKHKSLRRILKAESLDRSQVLYVGDELRDMKAARKARIDACAVTWGMHPERMLMRELPRHVARQPADLLTLFGIDSFNDPLALETAAGVT